MNKEQIEKNAHIPTEEILKDISDTEADIIRWKREIKGFELIGDKMSRFRADARKGYIKEAKNFIEQLTEIVKCRNKKGRSE